MKKIIFIIIVVQFGLSINAQVDMVEELKNISNYFTQDCQNYDMNTYEYKVSDKQSKLVDSIKYRIVKKDAYMYSLMDQMETIHTDNLYIILDHDEKEIHYKQLDSKDDEKSIVSFNIEEQIKSWKNLDEQCEFFSVSDSQQLGIRYFLDAQKLSRIELVYHKSSYKVKETKMIFGENAGNFGVDFSNRMLHSIFSYNDCNSDKNTTHVPDIFKIVKGKIKGLQPSYDSYTAHNLIK